MKKFTLLLCLLGWVIASAQDIKVATHPFPADSTALFADIESRAVSSIATLPPTHRKFITEALRERDRELRSEVRDSVYLFDGELQPYLTGLFERIVSENDLDLQAIVFLDQDYIGNALSMGQGIFVVNLGLLRQLKTEEELLFVLCHEVAHDQLGHHMQHLTEIAGKQQEISPTLRKLSRPSPFQSSRKRRGLVQNLRDHTYDGFRRQRARELQADSLALVYFDKMGLGAVFGQRALAGLDARPGDLTESHELIDLLRTEAYPIKEVWLKPPPQLFGGAGFGKGMATVESPGYLWDTDSLSTHPALADRQWAMDSYVNRLHSDTLAEGRLHGFGMLTDMAQLQSHFLRREYGLALIASLRMLYADPSNELLRHYSATALQWVSLAAGAHDFDEAVPPPEFFADTASQAVVKMLRQMRFTELQQFSAAYTQQYATANQPTSEK